MHDQTRQQEAHNRRLIGLQASLEKEDLEAFLVTHLKNIHYLIGFSGTAGAMVVTPEEATLYVDPRYTTQASQESIGAAVEETARDVFGDVLTSLGQRLHRRLGFESARLSHADYTRLEAALGADALVPSNDLVERLRSVKDSLEIGAIRRAVEIADAAFDDFCSWISPGMSEIEVAARLEFFQRNQGGDRKPSETVVASGPRTGLIHGKASHRQINAGEAVMIDIGIVVDGYTSDLTRTVHLGSPPARFEEIYQLVYEAQARAEAELRPGMSGKAIDALAREMIEAQGLGQNFGHALGHSLGLEIHERPHFSITDETIIEPGMVLTVEPGVYMPSQFGVRIEDVVLVTKEGCEILTQCSRDLTIVENGPLEN